MKNTNTKTMLGQTIQPGDYIAYGQALGRCAAMNIGRVIDAGLKSLPPRWKGENRDEQEFRCKIVGLDWDYRTDSYVRGEKLRTLMFSDRIVVLHPDTVPANLKALLESL